MSFIFKINPPIIVGSISFSIKIFLFENFFDFSRIRFSILEVKGTAEVTKTFTSPWDSAKSFK